MQHCLIDLIYDNHSDSTEFVCKTIQKIADMSAVDYSQSPQQDWQLAQDNKCQWDFIVHILSTAAERGPPYCSVAIVQFMLNCEVSLRELVSKQLADHPERLEFYENEWLAMLGKATESWKHSLNLTNSVAITQDYVDTLMDAWLNQHSVVIPDAHVTVTCDPPSDVSDEEVEVGMEEIEKL